MDGIDWSSLLHTAIGVLVGVGIVLGILPTNIGNKLLGHAFDRKLDALKHEQNTKIEALRARLGVAGDRGVRANEREFNALTLTWDAFISAYIATKVCVMAFISYPEFKQMSDDEIAAFLGSTELSETQQNQVMTAKDRTNMFTRIIRFRQINAAGRAIFEAREMLRKQGIFMLATIEAQFETAFSICTAAQVEESMRLDHGVAAGREASMRIIEDGDKIAAELKKTVRNRLMQEEVAVA